MNSFFILNQINVFGGLLALGSIFLVLMAGLWYTHRRNTRMENILAELKPFYKKENSFNAKFVFVTYGDGGERIEKISEGKIIYFAGGFFVIHFSNGLSPFTVAFWGLSSHTIPTENKPHSFLALSRMYYQIKETELICKSYKLLGESVELQINPEQGNEKSFEKFCDYFKRNYAA